jgi:transposase InsO family protein
MVRHPKPLSQTWRTFLNNHAKELVSTDFFVVATISFRVLFVLVVLAYHRRCVLPFNIAAHPAAERTAQQMAEAFPWDGTPRYLLHDRDSICGDPFRQRVRGMGTQEVLTDRRVPWQNPYAERLIGSIRRECLDDIIVFSQSSLRRTLTSYFEYSACAHASGVGERCA